MKVVVQRVLNSNVVVNNELVSEIKSGFLLLVGIEVEDNEKIVEKVADKISKLRIFEDSEGKMNLDIKQIEGEILSISQFTLCADVKKGNRPSFSNAARPENANNV